MGMGYSNVQDIVDSGNFSENEINVLVQQICAVNGAKWTGNLSDVVVGTIINNIGPLLQENKIELHDKMAVNQLILKELKSYYEDMEKIDKKTYDKYMEIKEDPAKLYAQATNESAARIETGSSYSTEIVNVKNNTVESTKTDKELLTEAKEENLNETINQVADAPPPSTDEVVSDRMVFTPDIALGVKDSDTESSHQADTKKARDKIVKVINEDAVDAFLANRVRIVKEQGLGKDTHRILQTDYYNTHRVLNADNIPSYRRAHVFMTVPSCHIFRRDAEGNVIFKPKNISDLYSSSFDPQKHLSEELLQDKELSSYIINGNLDVASFLDSGLTFNGRPRIYMFPLMNLIKTVGNMPSYELKTRQGPSNFFGNSTEMVVNSNEGLSQNSLSITFEDDREATVARLNRVWTRYAESSSMGIIEPTKYCRQNKIIDYMSTIYTFITDESNTELQYWFRCIGCFPKSRAYDFLNISVPVMKDRSDITVPYKVTFPEDMSQHILGAFNMLAHKADKTMAWDKNSGSYDFAKAKSTMITPLSDPKQLIDIGAWYTDIFFISNNRRYPSLDLSTYNEEMVKSAERQRFFLFFGNRDRRLRIVKANNEIECLPIDPTSDIGMIAKSITDEARVVEDAVIEMDKLNENVDIRKYKADGSIASVDNPADEIVFKRIDAEGNKREYRMQVGTYINNYKSTL